MRTLSAWFAVLASALLFSSACDSGPQAGELEISLVSPDADDGAIMFEIRALESYSIEGLDAACTGCQAFVYQETEMRLRAIVIGSFGTGPVARLSVSDVRSPEGYVLTVLDAAGPDLQLRSADARSLRFLP